MDGSPHTSGVLEHIPETAGCRVPNSELVMCPSHGLAGRCCEGGEGRRNPGDATFEQVR